MNMDSTSKPSPGQNSEDMQTSSGQKTSERGSMKTYDLDWLRADIAKANAEIMAIAKKQKWGTPESELEFARTEK